MQLFASPCAMTFGVTLCTTSCTFQACAIRLEYKKFSFTSLPCHSLLLSSFAPCMGPLHDPPRAGMSLVPATEVVPAPADKARPITGYPPGSWLNYGSWSPDGKHVSFTVRVADGCWGNV